MIKTTCFIDIASHAQNQTQNICDKFYKNVESYTNSINDEILKTKIISQTDALLFKFISVSTNLEFLWQIYYLKKDRTELQDHKTEWQNNTSQIDLIFLENVVIQLRSFIDFSQKLSCLALGYTKPIDGTKDFYKILSKINNEKAKKIEYKFEETLGENKWGNMVKCIRDKVIHYDIVRTKSEFQPTIQGKNYERFSQDLENDMFVFLTELQEILFDKKWVPG